MYGLTIRWSLFGVREGTDQALRDYVRDESTARFTGMAGLHEKRWQIAPGGFFAGVYIWASEQARADFLESFRANPSRVTQLVGHDPDVIQEWELVGLAQGAEGPPAV